jgi:hypothetical protein
MDASCAITITTDSTLSGIQTIDEILVLKLLETFGWAWECTLSASWPRLPLALNLAPYPGAWVRIRENANFLVMHPAGMLGFVCPF